MEISVGGDSWQDVAHQLRDLLVHVEEHGPACGSVSGGASSGHVVQVVEDPTMTPERYRAELDAYLERKREEP